MSGYKGTLATGGSTCIDKVKCLFCVISLVAIKVLSVKICIFKVSISGLLSYFLSGVFLQENTENSLKIVQEYIEQYEY